MISSGQEHPLLPITIAAMKNFTATSFSRNKKLTFVFNEMGYMEELAMGMDTFRTLREKYKLPLPIIEFDGLNVVVTFSRGIDVVSRLSGNKAFNELTKDQLEGYDWIRVSGEVSTREYSAHFDIGYKTAQRYLTKMKELGLIGDNGEDTNSPNYKYVAL